MSLTNSSFEVSTLTELRPEDVTQQLTRLITQLQELNPTLDLKRGVFKDTLAYYHAILETALRTNLQRYQSARSLQQIAADPTLADPEVVNEVLSNWGVTRKIGTKATGSITIELSLARTVILPLGFTFEANGLVYTALQTFIARTSSAQLSEPTDRLLTQLSNGNWAFTVEVEAADIGAKFKLNAGNLIIPNRPIVNYVTSYATTTFANGMNTETNAELLSQLQIGLSAKTLSNRTNMRAYLRSVPAFSGNTNQSIVGYGDAEMLRDAHTIFPVSYGGRVDWYIRGQEAMQRASMVKTATCVSITGSTSTWQFSLLRADAPGFYEVTKIRRAADIGLNSGFELIQDIRSNDLTAPGFLPDIQTIAEGAYTAFQTAIIRFVDTVTSTIGLTVGATASYVCDVTGTPLIAEVQTQVSSRDVRNFGADVLIKAPVPCFVQVSLTINKEAGDGEPDLISITSAIVSAINQTDFIGRLDGSRLIEVVHAFLAGNLSVTKLDLFGRIRRPDGSLQYLRGPDSLIVPEQPARMVTAKTVQFFAETADVSISVVSVIPTAS